MLEEISVIIIDDEQRARRVLENLLERYCKEVNVLDSCSNVQDAIPRILELKPDAIFLDIEMPESSGFELLNQLGNFSCDVVFVTAYNNYAVQAFEVSAIDYLLKPVSIDKLEGAVKKLKKNANISQIGERLKALEENLENSENKRLVISSKSGYDYIKQSDITHISADGSYSEIYLKNKTRVVASKKLKFIEKSLLDSPGFYRCHRSYIVNLSCVEKYNTKDGAIYMSNGMEVRVSREKKDEFSKLLHRSV